MTPERYEKACRLYDAALEIKQEARNAFLETECGSDQELRREIESLLAAHERVGDYFASPAFEVARGLSPNTRIFRWQGRVSCIIECFR